MTVSGRALTRLAGALALVGLVLAAIGFARLSGPGEGGPGGARGGLGPATPETLPVVPAAPDPVEGEPVEERPVAAAPVAVEIPAIGVSAAVVPVPAVGGVLTPPADVRMVGWWQDGAAPGSVQGAVLLTGHTSSRGAGVFDDLGRLRAGDVVRVVTDRGQVVYRVGDVQVHERARVAELAPRLFSRRSTPRLVLATCSGYDGSEYRTTTVVVAVTARGGAGTPRGS